MSMSIIIIENKKGGIFLNKHDDFKRLLISYPYPKMCAVQDGQFNA